MVDIISTEGEMEDTITVDLCKDAVPKTAEGFKTLCTGEKGLIIPHAGVGFPQYYRVSYRVDHRLVNWDCAFRTAISDIEMEDT
ncbi:hypothetical protein OROHE_002404 [Orobanche hederae]